MSLTIIINFLAVIFGLITIGLMIRDYRIKEHQHVLPPLTPKKAGAFSLLAIIAFIADTVGVGSYAVVIAGCKLGKLLPDEWLPGITNGAQLIPGIVESILFLHVFHVQPTMLILFVSSACVGGVVGGLIVSRMNQHYIQVSMLIAFAIMSVILFCNQMGWMHLVTAAHTVHGTKLALGCIGLFIAGALTCVGVGIYSVIQIILLLLGVAPWVAFPVMSTAGALQQSFATSTLTLTSRVPLKPALLMTCVGVIGVFIALPLITHLSANKMHWLLLIIIVYNIIMMARSVFKK
jgi:uncharacterized membrane protein YfcA